MRKSGKIIVLAAVLGAAAALITGVPAVLAAGATERNAPGNASSGVSGGAVEARYAVFADGVFQITSAGRYILSGTHTGQVRIQAGRNDIVELVLDNVTLHNDRGPAVFAPRSQRVDLLLTEGSVNNISDGNHPNDEANAAIYIQHDLSISGKGTLNITGNYHHGIRVQDTLTVNDGTIAITAKGDAMRGRDAVIIKGGNFTLNSGGDGIQSNNDSNPNLGQITINGGNFIIQAGDDGIQGETAVTINGGVFHITAKDDGITCAGPVLISGGVIRITDCYEGIEGLNVTITGGDIDIFSRDDGINARERSAIAGGAARGAVAQMRGRFMTPRTVNNNIFVRITGGNIHVHALTDGIDSNYNVFLDGGTLHISGPSRGMEGAIDLDGTFLITGGELVTAGSVLNVSGQSTQPVLIVAHSRQFMADSLIEITDKRGVTILSYTAENAFYMSAFTSPGFIVGETYSLRVNGDKIEDITLTNTVTNSGSGNNNRGFEGGRGGGFRAPPRPWI